MKPIAIIAIIAAVVVVGGACAGVAFSGVLNGSTTGPGGDNPVVPTEPVEPTPTETPTETPTPTETQMSTFSPMTSSGSSSSSSSGNTPAPTPTETPEEPTTVPVPSDGVVLLPDGAISGSPVSSMTFPSGYTGDTVTITPVSNSPDTPAGVLMTVKIDLDVDLTPGQEVTINFKVPVADLPEPTAVNAVVLYHKGAAGWTPLPTVYISSTVNGYALYAATATEFSPFAVVFCTHDGEVKYSAVEPTEEGAAAMHKKICNICNAVVASEECNYDEAKYVSLAGDEHQRTCTLCGLVAKEPCSAEEGVYSHVEDTKTHGKKCTSCGDFIGTTVSDCTDFDYTQITSTTASEHNKTCNVCYVLYTEACTNTTSEGVTSDNNGHHGLTCEFCEKVFSGVSCTYVCVPDDGTETHTEKCTTCGFPKPDGLSSKECEFSSYTWDRDTDKHTAKCTACGQEKTAEACTYMTTLDNAEGVEKVDGVTHKSVECTTCGHEKENIPCTYGAFTASEESDVQHSKNCICGAVITEDCTYDYTKATPVTPVEDGTYQHTYNCTVETCDNVKTVLCKATSEYTQNETEDKHTLTCTECKTVLHNNIECFTTDYTDNLATEPPTRTCECGRTAELEASVTTSSGITTYYFSVEEAITAAAETEGVDVVTLWKDIDLTDKTWTTISTFADIFDGNGKTISNLNTNLFGTVSGTVKNLNVDTVTIVNAIKNGANGFIGTVADGGLVDNCKVSHVDIKWTAEVNAKDTTDGFGGVIGGVQAGATVQNCEFSDITVTSNGKTKRTGAVFSSITGTVKGCVFTNVNFIVADTETLEGWVTSHGGGLAGDVNGGAVVEDCVINNMQINVYEAAGQLGGVFGKAHISGQTAPITLKDITVNGLTMNVGNTEESMKNVAGFIAQPDSRKNDVRVAINNCHIYDLDMTLTSSKQGESAAAGFISGLCGGVDITSCSVSGKIDGTNTPANIGGFIGDAGWYGSIEQNFTNCVTNVAITVKDSIAGGFIAVDGTLGNGTAILNFTDCEANGSVTVVDGGTGTADAFCGKTIE